ncbi:MAG: hypothetical protein U1E83_06770 [Methylotetracoccus sp.]
MSRARDTATLDLFEIPEPDQPQPGAMDYRSAIAGLVSEALRSCALDRYEVAARMSRLMGVEESKHILDAWASDARESHNIPFYKVPVLEAVCETHRLTQWLAGTRGGRLLIGREALNAELGRLERSRDAAQQRIRQLKRLMGEME